MEFPHLGEGCYKSDCKRLDWLPMKCDACSQLFCKDHIKYDAHACPEAHRKNRRVPVCPLCNIPIPLMPGEQADIKVGAHIDTDCQSDPAKDRRKIYTNRCSNKGCKTKELIPVTCERCRRNFCLKHRHEADHDCQGFQGSSRAVSNAGAAAAARSSGRSGTSPRPAPSSSRSGGAAQQRRASPQQPRNLRAMQQGMTEEQALQAALQMSMQDSGAPNRERDPTAQELSDEELARALAAEEQQRVNRAQHQTTQRQDSSRCHVS